MDLLDRIYKHLNVNNNDGDKFKYFVGNDSDEDSSVSSCPSKEVLVTHANYVNSKLELHKCNNDGKISSGTSNAKINMIKDEKDDDGKSSNKNVDKNSAKNNNIDKDGGDCKILFYNKNYDNSSIESSNFDSNNSERQLSHNSQMTNSLTTNYNAVKCQSIYLSDSTDTASTVTQDSETFLKPMKNMDKAVGVLRKHDGEIIYITERITKIGRDYFSKNSNLHKSETKYISRYHYQVVYEAKSQAFFVEIFSKNGILVDGCYLYNSNNPYKLPNCCVLRFPNTKVIVKFERFV